MYFFYFDESGNPGKTKLYSAVGIPSDQWLASLNSLIELRKEFKRDYGIDPRKEIHANKLLTGHGNYSKTHKLTEGESLEIVKKMFLRVLGFKGVKILNAAGPDSKAMVTLEYLLNRINHLADSENQDVKLFLMKETKRK